MWRGRFLNKYSSLGEFEEKSGPARPKSKPSRNQNELKQIKNEFNFSGELEEIDLNEFKVV